jgi:hypothetical protein
VAQAIDLAQQYNSAEGGLVQLRYLFGGIVVQENEGRIVLARLLAVAGPNAIEQLALHYPDYLAALEPLTTWIPIWFRRRISISDYDADLHSSRDLVGIGAEVDAFAYLIAAKSLTPPLAVGLFGDWGSGKSFFMEAMRSRINEITENARVSARPQRDLSVYKHVVQIEFNAWQYVEGNLWASLMEHILRNLKKLSEKVNYELDDGA